MDNYNGNYNFKYRLSVQLSGTQPKIKRVHEERVHV